MSFWKTHQFKKLNNLWRKKLEQAGFEDIEKPDGELKHQGTVSEDLRRRTNFKPEIVTEVVQYHSWAEDMANHAHFRSALDRRIWGLHARGLSSREIRERLPVVLDQSTICSRITRIRNYLRLQIRKSKAA